jgi:hypothetical protein
MKVEDVEKAIDLLYQYHYIDELLKKSYETKSSVAVLSDKINNTNIDAEKFQYRKEIVDSIQKLISDPYRNGYEFGQDVLMYGLDMAVIKLEQRLDIIKCKIEKL